jgi:hypothetical protein
VLRGGSFSECSLNDSTKQSKKRLGRLTDSICARVFEIQIPHELIAREHDDWPVIRGKPEVIHLAA